MRVLKSRFEINVADLLSCMANQLMELKFHSNVQRMNCHNQEPCLIASFIQAGWHSIPEPSTLKR